MQCAIPRCCAIANEMTIIKTEKTLYKTLPMGNGTARHEVCEIMINATNYILTELNLFPMQRYTVLGIGYCFYPHSHFVSLD